MEKFTNLEVSLFTGYPKGSLCGFHGRGLIPASGGLSRPQVLALRAMRELRGLGVGVGDAREVMLVLWHTPEAELKWAFAVGRSKLVVIGDLASKRLLTDDEVVVSSKVEELLGHKAQTFDLSECWEKLELVINGSRNTREMSNGRNKVRGGGVDSRRATARPARKVVATAT